MDLKVAPIIATPEFRKALAAEISGHTAEFRSQSRFDQIREAAQRWVWEGTVRWEFGPDLCRVNALGMVEVKSASGKYRELGGHAHDTLLEAKALAHAVQHLSCFLVVQTPRGPTHLEVTDIKEQGCDLVTKVEVSSEPGSVGVVGRND